MKKMFLSVLSTMMVLGVFGRNVYANETVVNLVEENENYIITFVISSNKEINEEEYSSILNSLTIHDEKIRFKFTTIDMIALIFLIFVLSKKLYFSFLK